MSVNEHEAIEEVQEAVNRSKESSQPVAVIVRKGILSGEKQNKIDNVYPMIREDCDKINPA